MELLCVTLPTGRQVCPLRALCVKKNTWVRSKSSKSPDAIVVVNQFSIIILVKGVGIAIRAPSCTSHDFRLQGLRAK